MCNLSSVHLERGDVDGARREAERARWAASRLHAPLLEAVAATFMLAAVAPSGAREAWDDAWRSMKLIRDLQYCELDLARTIDRAARSAWPKMPRRALDAARSAMKIYRAISPSPELSALERWLGARSRPV